MVLYFNLSLFRDGLSFIREKIFLKKKTLMVAVTLVLGAILLLSLMDKPHYQRFSRERLFGGDEPKYLRMTYSLAKDMNVDVSNELIIEEGLEKAVERILSSGSRSFGHLSVIGKNGKIYHIHLPGISFLILPGFLLDSIIFPTTHNPEDDLQFLSSGFIPNKLYFTRLWLLILGISAFFLLARLLYYFFNSILLSTILLLIFILNSPVPIFIFQLYPEIAAAFFVLLVLNAILFPFKKEGLNYLSIVIGIGYIPWLHQRFIVLALSLYIVFIIQTVFFKKNFKRGLITSFLLFLTSLPYFYFFYTITGSPLPNSLHRLYGYPFNRLGMFPLGFFGHIFDFESGFLWNYPWTILALIGIYWGLKIEKKRAISLLIVFVPYYLLTCFNNLWHGLVDQPARFLVAIFPILLFFLAYTIIAFYKRRHYPLLILYIALVTLIFFNKKYWILKYNFKRPGVSHADVFPIIVSSALLILLYISIFAIDKFTEKKIDVLHLTKISSYAKHLNFKLNSSFLFNNLKKPIIYLPILILVLYIFTGAHNRDDKKNSVSLFQTFNKMALIKTMGLYPKEPEAEMIQKTDKEFVNLFNNVYNFRIENNQKAVDINLGSAFLHEKLPRGSYRVKLEIEDLVSDDTQVELRFLGDSRLLGFETDKDRAEVSTIFFLFKDRFVSPWLSLRLTSSELDGISGKLEIFPIPSVVFENELILRPFPFHNPITIGQIGEDPYNLKFITNVRKAGKKYKFSLYTLQNPDNIHIEEEILLATFEDLPVGNELAQTVNIGFDLPADFPEKKAGLALLVHDEKNRLLSCKSIWIQTSKKFCIFLKEFDNPAKIE
ncbi:MAG: hypothetical protein MUP98_08030 [Candidatus Aminicenantes bacterium]|nr:hypothetical protein [Candidatus Aminicenantes bacterium]